MLRNTKNCFQSSWRILNFSGMYIQIETFMNTIMSGIKNEGQNIKLRCYCALVLQKQQFGSRVQITSKVSSKKHPDTNEQTLIHDRANRHSQTGNKKKMDK